MPQIGNQIQAPERGQAKPAPGGVVPDLGQGRVIGGQAEPPGDAGVPRLDHSRRWGEGRRSRRPAAWCPTLGGVG